MLATNNSLFGFPLPHSLRHSLPRSLFTFTFHFPRRFSFHLSSFYSLFLTSFLSTFSPPTFSFPSLPLHRLLACNLPPFDDDDDDATAIIIMITSFLFSSEDLFHILHSILPRHPFSFTFLCNSSSSFHVTWPTKKSSLSLYHPQLLNASMYPCC